MPWWLLFAHALNHVWLLFAHAPLFLSLLLCLLSLFWRIKDVYDSNKGKSNNNDRVTKFLWLTACGCAMTSDFRPKCDHFIEAMQFIHERRLAVISCWRGVRGPQSRDRSETSATDDVERLNRYDVMSRVCDVEWACARSVAAAKPPSPVSFIITLLCRRRRGKEQK